MIPNGLSVSQPAAMWALLSLLIPILIHLFNRSQGRLVRIGHIDLIRSGRKVRVTEIRLAQWLLLLLRLCIFTLLSLLLAGLSGSLPGKDKTDKVFVTPAWLATTHRDEALKLLEKAKNTRHTTVQVLKTGFPALDRQSLETSESGTVLPAKDIESVWPYLLEQLGNGSNTDDVSVYAADYVLQFGIDRPTLPAPVTWKLSHPPGRPLVIPDSYRAVIAFQADRTADAQVMSTALEMLQQYRLPGLSWESVDYDQLDQSHLNADWLILLSNTGLDSARVALMQGATVVLSDAGSASAEPLDEYVDLPIYPFTRFMLKRYSDPRLDEHGDALPQQWRSLVATADAHPVLRERRSGDLRFLEFNSRFNPDWSSLHLQAEFPELLLQLMLDEDEQKLRYANARINPGRLQNDKRPANVDMTSSKMSLHGLLAAILALLWICERWLSERKSRETG